MFQMFSNTEGLSPFQSLLLRLSEKHGCFIKVPLDPWSNLPGVSYVYVLYKDFPEKPAIPIVSNPLYSVVYLDCVKRKCVFEHFRPGMTRTGLLSYSE